MNTRFDLGREVAGERFVRQDSRFRDSIREAEAGRYHLYVAPAWGYTRELYQRPGIAETVEMTQIKLHYYTTHETLEPTRIVPIGPELDFTAPHGRG